MKKEISNRLYRILLKKIKYFKFCKSYGGIFTNQEIKTLIRKGVIISESNISQVNYIEKTCKAYKGKNFSTWFYFKSLRKDADQLLKEKLNYIKSEI